MSQPSSIIGTPEEWHDYLHVKREPRKLKRTLLSKYQTQADKARIIHSIPDCAAKNSTQMRRIESKLEDAGLTSLAQAVRQKMCCALGEDIQKRHRQWAHRAVVLDIEARWIVQREAYLQEEARALSKSLMLSEDREQSSPELQECENELEQLNNLYWKYTRLNGALEGDIPSGPFSVAFRQHRKDPDWYLSEYLRADCVRRGGCCGRGCGCCEKDRGNKRQLWKRGHCTSACGCCVRTQKSQEDVSVTMQKDMEYFPFDIVALPTPYSERMYQAYIWGLTLLGDL